MNQKPPYKPLKQIPYHCVPACLSMVFDRRNIRHASQEAIGYELGMIIPNNMTHLFHKTRTGPKPKAGFGTQVAKKHYSINHYFRKHRIKLHETYFPPRKVTDISHFLTANVRANNDILACFNNRVLFGSGNYGHVCVVSSISNSTVTLLDPELAKGRKVPIAKLHKAIVHHSKANRGGFWVIS